MNECDRRAALQQLQFARQNRATARSLEVRRSRRGRGHLPRSCSPATRRSQNDQTFRGFPLKRTTFAVIFIFMLAPSAASDPEERWLCYGSNAERVFGGDPIIVLARSRAHAGHATLEVIGQPTNTTTFEIDGLQAPVGVD